MRRPLLCSGADDNGAELAALDLLKCGLAGHVEGETDVHENEHAVECIDDDRAAKRRNCDKNMPAGEQLQVRVTKIANTSQLRFSDLHGHVDLNVDAADQKATVDFTNSCGGTVRFGTGSFAVNVAEGASVELVAGTDTHLELDGRVSKLSFTGRCTVKPSSERIGEIVIPRDGASIGIVGNTLAADSIAAAGDPAELTVTAAGARRSASANQGLKVDVKKITDITLRSDTKPISLTVARYARRLVVGDDVDVTLKSGSADGLASLGSSRLNIGKSAVATDPDVHVSASPLHHQSDHDDQAHP
jgi:hypothetical protein